MRIAEIILVLVLGIYSIITGSKWKEINWIKKTFVLIAIIGAIVIGWNAYQDYKKQELIEKINSSYGELVDTTKAKIPTVQIGGGNKLYLENDGVFSVPPYTNLFKVFIKNNKLYLNTILRNRKGEVIAVIDENVWTIFDNNYEYNDDETAFEMVTRGERKVFFQIELKDGVANFSGYIYTEKGYGLYFYGAPGISFMAPIELNKPMPKKYIELKRIFKYPRAKYYGVRETY